MMSAPRLASSYSFASQRLANLVDGYLEPRKTTAEMAAVVSRCE